MKDLSIDDPEIVDFIMKEFVTPVTSSEKGLEQFKKGYDFIVNTRTADKTLKAFGDNYKDIKGLLFTKQQGLWNKVFPITRDGNNMLEELIYNPKTKRLESTGKAITNVLPNEVVLDRKALEVLTGYDIGSIFDEEGNGYVLTMRQPSPFKESKKFMRVRVVEGDACNTYRTPATWKTINAGDFDGDSHTTFVLQDDFSRALAQFETKYLFRTHSMQEDLYNFTNSQNLSNKPNSVIMEALEISSDPEVIKASKLIDGALKRGEEPSLVDLKEAIKDIILVKNIGVYTSTIDDILGVIGVVEKNGHKYINNYSVLTDPKSYSYKASRRATLDSATYRTNLADSIFGFYKQRYMANEQVITDFTSSPLRYIDRNNTRLMSNLVANIKTIDWDKTTIDNYFNVIINSIVENKDILKNGAYTKASYKFIEEINKSKEALKTLLNNPTESTQEDIAQNIIQVTQLIYNISDNLITHNKTINDELAHALEGKPSDSFEREFKRRQQFLEEYQRLSKKKTFIKDASPNRQSIEESILINDVIESLERQANIKYVEDINDIFKENRARVAVVDNEDLGGSEDAIWVNKNSKIFMASEIKNINYEGLKDSGLVKELNKLKNSQLTSDDIKKLIEKEFTNIESIKEVVEERGAQTPSLAKENIELYKILKKIQNIETLSKEDKKVLKIYNINNTGDIEVLKDNLITRMAENKAYKEPTLKARERKIKSRTLIDLYKTLLKVNSDLLIIESGKDTISLVLTEPIYNKKVLALGKGMSLPVKVFDDIDADIIMSANYFSRIDKLSLTTTFSNKFIGKQDIEFDLGTGKQTKKAFIYDEVPFLILENLNASRKPGDQKTDLMTLLANMKGLPGIADLGTTVLKKQDDGTTVYDNSVIVNAINNANESYKQYWSSLASVAQIIRATSIGSLLDKYNLWNAYNAKTNTGIYSKKDFEEAIKYYNPTSMEFYLGIQEAIKVLREGTGKTLEELLPEMTRTEQVMFTEDIENAFTHIEQGDIKDYEGTHLFSKNKAKRNVAKKSSIFIGDLYNPSETNARRNRSVLTQEAFYLGWNNFFRAVNGYNPNVLDILDGIAKQQLNYRLHVGGEIGLNFRPLDTKYAVFREPTVGGIMFNNDPVAGQISERDIPLINPSSGRLFKKGKNNISIAELQKDRGYGSIYSAMAKNYLDGTPYGSISHSDRIGQFLIDMMTARNTVEGVIEASNKNINKDIIFNAYIQAYRMTEDGPVLTVSPSVKKGTYGYLTGKGKDFISNKFNFYSMNELYNKADTSKLSLEDINKLEIPKEMEKDYLDSYNQLASMFEKHDKLTKNYTKEIDYSLEKNDFKHIEFSFGKDTTDAFKDDWIASQGIHIGKHDKGDTVNVAMAMEKYAGEAAYIEAQLNTELSNLKKVSRAVSAKEFEEYCLYNWLMAARKTSVDDFNTKLSYCNKTEQELDTILKGTYDRLNTTLPELNEHYNKYITTKMEYINMISRIYNEPFGNTMIFLSPFMPENKTIKYKTIKNAVHNQFNFNKYDPTKQRAVFESNMMFNFFEANEAMDREIGKLIGLNNMATVLKERKLIDNVDITNKAHEFLSENFDINNLYVKPSDLDSPTFREIHSTILNVIDSSTDINVPRVIKGAKNPVEEIKKLYSAIDFETKEILEALPEQYEKSLSSIQMAIANNPNRADVEILDKAYNYLMARSLIAQRIAELNKNTMKNAINYIQELEKNGYSLCNKLGQKISMDSYIRPIGYSSLSFLKENIELAANNQSIERFAQFVLEKALNGEIYIAKTDMVNQFEDKLYTRKTPSKLWSFLKDVSKTSSAIQMSMPTKMINRLLRFTATDYLLGGMFNPNVYKYIPTAAKQITAAVYSKGKTITEDSDLYDYFIREGQPLNVANRDPINYTENINKTVASVTDKLTKPLSIQNHLGRYALWLSLKEGFDNNNPWFGPCYHLKDQIMKMPDNRDKALFIMDYILGSPGGFPYLSKKTSGLMMYATFPMNLTRTGGAYLMSLGKLAREGITSENAPHWIKTIASPSASLLITGLLTNAAITYLCDVYGVSEEDEEEWKKENVAIDPFGTILGDSPSVVYDSVNPAFILKEMFVNPWTSEYNKTLGEKIEGFLSKNVIGSLNPAFKIPAEVITKKDYYGTSPMDTSNSYTMLENAIRKTLGFVTGSGVANSVVDQYKINSSNPDSNFLNTLWKGIAKGFSSDLGNQKSWKKDTSNYYATIESIRNYYYATKGNLDFDATPEDLANAEYMADERSTTHTYGAYNADDFDRVNKMLKKMIHSRTEATTLYLYIADEYNKGTSEATLRAALNNNSIIRKLNSLQDKEGYFRTLTTKDLESLERAIMFENKTYRMLQEFFPTSAYKKNYYTKKYNNYYNSGGVSSYTPRTPSVKKPYASPINYYPQSSNKKYKSYNPYAHIDRVDVRVSPEMAVWKNDFNAIEDMDKEEWYLNNPYYNSLSDWEKKQKGGN